MSSALTELNRPPTSSGSYPLPPRKRLILEPDQDFFNDNDDDEPLHIQQQQQPEQDEEQPPSDLEEDDDDALQAQRELIASTSIGLKTASIDAFSSSKGFNQGLGFGNDAKGKSRMMSFEEDQEFGDEEFEFTSTTTKTTTTIRKPLVGENYDFTSKYGSINSLNLQQQAPLDKLDSDGWLEQIPIEATKLDGTKLTFRRKKRLELTRIGLNKSSGEDPKELAKLAQSSLEKPFQQLVQSIETDLLMQKKQREADATSAAFGSTNHGNDNKTDKKNDENKNSNDKIIETQLWTDRYRPKKFTDLLGDERVHRSALSWLKEWDNCVFKGRNNNPGSTGAAGVIKKERRNAKRGREGNTFGANGSGTGFGEEIAPDPLGRPHEKILLLSGPPGLGKTTLAHVLARQAGYQVHEVNASDDRTSRVVEERIRNALDSTSLSLGWSEKEKFKSKANNDSGGDRIARPTCVVVDEIDGAANGGDSSFIKTLVKLVTEGSSTKKPLKRKNGTKGKKDRPLLRPIICICNDLYAPVLRPLRPLAKIIRFQPPTNTMLTKRLRTICEMESMRAENKHLTLLVETAEGDLRSCLNTLQRVQFIKRKGDVVDEKAIRSTSLGMKDTGTSSIQVLDRLFKKPSRKKGVSTDDRYITRIVRDVQTSGEYEKIAQGCFENYLSARDTDNEAFPRISEALDWLYFFDRLDGKLRTDRDYELLGYVPYSFVPWYPLFSSQTPNPVELPKTDYEMYLQRTAHDEIATTFSLNLPLSLKSTFTATTLVSELLPLFNRIVSPDLKPINSQVVKNEERQKLMRTVNTLILMKTGFVIDKNEEGQLSYKLDPPIDVFVHYEGKRASDIAPGRYAVRQMITREVDAELLRRGNENEGTTRDASDILSAYKTKPAAATIAPEVKQAVDFFGRAIVTKPLTASQEAAALLAPPPPKKVKQTMYKFNEGFSNAVRTTKRVSDFFA
ncbi:hypothetical protein JCM3765_007278 [Sporobolomyces pararoseus]